MVQAEAKVILSPTLPAERLDAMVVALAFSIVLMLANISNTVTSNLLGLSIMNL